MTRPADHAARMDRARLALEGLSVGDAFGERFFRPSVGILLIRRETPPPPWRWTDDTAMALSIVEVLDAHGAIDQDALAEAFGRRYRREPNRGYGPGAHDYLSEIARGEPWELATRAAFSGQGSFGNGGAMRVAPVGAYFADDLPRCVEEARRSAQVTHFHPEGQAGAIAVAVAAALATTGGLAAAEAGSFVRRVAERTPPGRVRDGLEEALRLPAHASIATAADALGNGSRVSAQDTVPLCVWSLGRWGASYEEALWQTVSALGDRDTTCAIVGGVSALACGLDALPAAWRAAREPLPA